MVKVGNDRTNVQYDSSFSNIVSVESLKKIA